MKQKPDDKKYLFIHGEKLIQEIAQDFPVVIQEYDGTKVGLVKIDNPEQLPEKLKALFEDGIEIL